MNRRKQSEAASRFEERRRRENDAPRLRDELTRLQSLKMVVEEFSRDETTPLASHTRHVVVARAPALFVIPCGDSECDGSHDLTREFMRSLQSSAETFGGEHACYGQLKNMSCHRRMRYKAFAQFEDAP